MLYSTPCEYGVRALAQLAIQVPPGRFCQLRDICKAAGLPQHFVAKILPDLVRVDIVSSAKGRGGGFALRRPPESITLREIVDAIDGESRVDRCILGIGVCDDDPPAPGMARWAETCGRLRELMEVTTLADIANAIRHKRALQAV